MSVLEPATSLMGTPSVPPSPSIHKEPIPKVPPERYADPLGSATAIPRASEVEDDLAVDAFFAAAKDSVSDPHIKILRKPSIDYDNDPVAGLRLATSLRIHRSSRFLDTLQTNKEEFDDQMRAYQMYTAVRTIPDVSTPELSGSTPSRPVKRSVVGMDEVDKSPKHAFHIDDDQQEEPWTFESAQHHIVEVIQASTVPKAKKKKKKKKKKRNATPEPTADILSKEEAYLNYQMVVTEEKLRQEQLAFQFALHECRTDEERLIEVRKKYDQEIQACKNDFADQESALLAFEDEWNRKVHHDEEQIRKAALDIKYYAKALEEQIEDEERQIADLQKHIAVWEKFKIGLMVRNQAKINQLLRDIEAQRINREAHIRLTEEAVNLAEEAAKKAEEKAMDALCNRHIKEVKRSLPPEEIQEIENNDFIITELNGLNKVRDDLVQQTDHLQRKIVHQTATAQILLESINVDNAKIARKQLLVQRKDLREKIDTVADISDRMSSNEVYANFQELDEVQAFTGGLTVIGINVAEVDHNTRASTLQHRTPRRFAHGELHDNVAVAEHEEPKVAVTVSENLWDTGLRPGFLIKENQSGTSSRSGSPYSRDTELFMEPPMNMAEETGRERLLQIQSRELPNDANWENDVASASHFY